MNNNDTSIRVKHFSYNKGKKVGTRIIPVTTCHMVALFRKDVPEQIVDESIERISNGLAIESGYAKSNIIFCSEEQYANVFSAMIRATETAYWFKDIKDV